MLKDIIGGLKSKYGNYAVLGNHDHFQYNFLHLFSPLFRKGDEKPADLKALKNALTDAGVRLLVNESEKAPVLSDDIWITGIDSLFFDDKKIPDVKVPETAGFTILLSHYPEAINYYGGKVDVILSGHTHGGQITIFGFPLITRSGVMKKFSRGVSAHGDTALYVSKGLGVSKYFPFRFFARPDFNIVEIIGESNEKD
jgi:hypothetical protein